MRVLLIAGGWSPERDISLIGAKSIAKAMRMLGHDVTEFTLTQDLNALVAATRGQDVAFINLHGAPGEDGLVQAILERVGLPYQGSRPAGSFLALHKSAAKAVFAAAGLQTPRGMLITAMPEPGWTCPLPFPVFVKSNTGGSSLHLSKAADEHELRTALKDIFDAGSEALVEEFIPGKEVTCGVLGDQALPPVLIAPRSTYFDFHDKYAGLEGVELCPAPLPAAVIEAVRANALKAHRALGLTDYSRADFIVHEDGTMDILEVNTLPGMTDVSLVPKEAAAIGMTFPELIEDLLKRALEKKSA